MVAVLIREGSPGREGAATVRTWMVTVSLRALIGTQGFFYSGGNTRMETRIALIGIIVENHERTEEINRLLHEYSGCIIGRMGIPYRQQGIAIISVVLDAPQETISSLSGKLGMLKGVSAKTVYSKKTVS